MKPLIYILPLEYPVKGGVEVKNTEFIEKSAYDEIMAALKTVPCQSKSDFKFGYCKECERCKVLEKLERS